MLLEWSYVPDFTATQLAAMNERCRWAIAERVRYEAFCRVMGIPIKYLFADGYRPYRESDFA